MLTEVFMLHQKKNRGYFNTIW